MKLLLDTQLILWSLLWPHRLSAEARQVIENERLEPYFSTISIAEIAIKRALQRPDFAVEPKQIRDTLLANGYRELVLEGDHACRLTDLPPLHRDPFDRLLIAQSLATGMPLLTADAALGAYGASVRVLD